MAMKTCCVYDIVRHMHNVLYILQLLLGRRLATCMSGQTEMSLSVFIPKAHAAAVTVEMSTAFADIRLQYMEYR